MNKEKVDTELAYLAGLFEGEGSAHISRHVTKDAWCGYHHEAVVTIAMTDFEPVNSFHKRWGGKVTKVNRQKGNPAYYLWVKKGARAQVVAMEIIPYIKSPRKHGALQCVIDYCDTLQVTRSSLFYRLSIETLRIREELREKCRAFNAKGKNAHNRTEIEIGAISKIKLQSNQLELF